MTSNRQRYLTALFGLDAVIRRVPGDAWPNASPCEGWTTRDVVDHNLFLVRTVQGMAEGRDAAAPRTDDDGLPPVVDDALALEAIDHISAHEDLLRQPMVLGDAVPTASSDPLGRLLAFCGRDVDAAT